MPASAKERSSLEKHLCSFSTLCFPFCFLNCFFFAFSTFFFHVRESVCSFAFFFLFFDSQREATDFSFFFCYTFAQYSRWTHCFFFFLDFLFSPFRVTHKLLLSNVVIVKKKKSIISPRKRHTHKHTHCAVPRTHIRSLFSLFLFVGSAPSELLRINSLTHTRRRHTHTQTHPQTFFTRAAAVQHRNKEIRRRKEERT